jgi:hypothetical protein
MVTQITPEDWLNSCSGLKTPLLEWFGGRRLMSDVAGRSPTARDPVQRPGLFQLEFVRRFSDPRVDFVHTRLPLRSVLERGASECHDQRHIRTK